jgi:PAS domain S-box-containing protein
MAQEDQVASSTPLGEGLPPDVLGSAIERTADIVMVTESGEDPRILYVNPAFERITGYRAEEAVGRKPSFLRGAGTSDEEIRRIETALRERRSARAELLNYRKDGSPFWIEIEASTTQSPSVGCEYCVFVERDVTARKNAESARREQERSIATLFSNLPGMAYRCSEGGTRRMEFVSAGCRELTGFEPSAIVGNESGFEALIEPGDRAPVREAIARAVHAGEAFEIAYRITTRDGSQKWVWERGRAVPGLTEGNRAIEGFMTDITERKLLESQVLQNERLESVGTLAGGIAHDLNNVFSPIVMAGELLSDRSSDKEESQLLSVISSSAKRGTELVRQILLFARGMEGPRVAVEASEIFAELRKFLESTLPKSIEVRMEIAPGTGTIAGDPIRLHQMLLSLSVNARDAMPQGGSLVIMASAAYVPASGPRPHPDAVPGDFVRIDVSDNGCGIPENLRGQISDPFFTTKGVGRGSGLGLSTARSIAKAHCGFITFTSSVGIGTTFSVFLPTAESGLSRPSRGGASRSPFGPIPRGNGETILVVDDEESIRVIMRSSLENFGFKVVTASDGQEALQVLGNPAAPISAALVDIQMPGIGGTMTIKALRNLRPDLPIVGTSGYATGKERDEAAANGAVKFLEKPFSIDTLVRTVHAALAGKTA